MNDTTLRDYPSSQAAASTARGLGWALALVMVSFNLRPPFSNLAPVLPEVVRGASLSGLEANVLAMMPVLCLGVFGFIAPRLAGRFGTERTIFLALLTLAAGNLLRGLAAFPPLLLGTIAAGAAIGVAGVLMPTLIKRDFARNASLVTGIYTMTMSIGAASGAGTTAPLSQIFGSWQIALAIWAAPVVLAVLIWLPYLRQTPSSGNTPQPVTRYRIGKLWRNALAWQVTLYMGLQGAISFIVFSWLAPLLRDRGIDPVTAGILVSVTMLVQISTALAAPVIASRRRSQGSSVAIAMVTTLIGFLCCLYAPLQLVWLWTALLGLGLGACFSLGLTLIVLRSADAKVSVGLSSMAQSVGYIISASGPLFAGLFRDWTGSWSAAGWLVIVIGMLAIAVGLFAGRALEVTSEGSTEVQQKQA